ncbi:MAG TPA: hypothetical protein PLR99_26845 [Polyangiaceae bacterium]|nr:hypothetical protein [Polyangiaceae bacterium]
MAYRHAEAALLARTDALEAELRALDERRRHVAELDAEVQRVVAQLGKNRSLLGRLREKRGLPLIDGLDSLRVASPCSEPWANMKGTDQARHCTKCDKNVYNLSAMTRAEAELLLLESEERPCLQLWRRADGTLLTADCPVGAIRKKMRLLGIFVVGGTLAGAALAALTYVAHPPRVTVTQGGL